MGDVAGGADNDIYIIDDASISIYEATGGGSDVLKTSVSYKLAVGNDIEVLVATGKADINITGNELGGEIVGNKGDNTLSGMGGEDCMHGGRGADWLIGGEGQDQFVFSKRGGQDTIADFQADGVDHDTIVLFGKVNDFGDLSAIAHETSKGLLLDLGKGDSLFLKDISLGDLDASHFDFNP